MDVFAFKECVRQTEAMETAQFEQPLAIVIGLPLLCMPSHEGQAP